MAKLPSIHEVKPPESGGPTARSGFMYQDHVAVKCLLNMFEDPTLQNIWFEGLDDIVILRGDNIVEFIQVKSNDLSSRWSVDKLISEELIQKSLSRGVCQEDVLYRIVTSYDVDSVLSVLKYRIGDSNRNTEKIDLIHTKILNKVNIGQNQKGHTVRDWLDKCWWEKLSDSMEDLQAKNLILLEDTIYKDRQIQLPIDQKKELYQQLLSLVRDASLPNQKNSMNRSEINQWFDDKLSNFTTPKTGTEKLITKMQEAGIPDSTIEVAKEMKWKYKNETLNHIFVSSLSINTFKDTVLSKLHNLKIDFDADKLNMSDMDFYRHCNQVIDQLAVEHNIPISIAKGCMYDITNRCSHRFTKVKS